MPRKKLKAFVAAATMIAAEEATMRKGRDISRTMVRKMNQKVIAAINKHLGANASIPLLGTPLTAAALKAIFQAELDAILDVDKTLAVYRGAVGRAATAADEAHRFRGALRAYVISRFGPDALEVLGDFAFEAPKARGPKKIETKAAGVKKAEATRKARGTMGKRQREKIKGKPVAK